MTSAQATRAAVILRDLAASLPWTAFFEHQYNAFKAECCELARVLDRYAEWKQVAEAPPLDERGAGWTA